MSDTLRQWARDLRRRLGYRAISRAERKEPELPYLPERSPVPWTTPEDSTNGTAGSALFTRLPPEIRHTILVIAFGGRTLHMSLRLGAPLLPRSKRPLLANALQCMPHGGITAAIEVGVWPNEVMDAARRVREATPGTKPVWQWYTEGIQVLYGTNTLFIEGGPLIATLLQASSLVLGSALSRRILVPPRQMALLTKLELVWQWTLFMRPDQVKAQSANRSEMARSFDLLPRTFPHLLTLYISYLDGLYDRSVRPEEYEAEIEQELFLPLHQMACRFGRLGKCIVEIPTVVFQPLLARAKKGGNEIDQGHSYHDVRFWWQPEPMQTGKVGLWVKSGIEGNLFFDHKGEARTRNTQLSILF
ncbi:hypothetical protein CMQ_3775 [Grosmannia clavigera kw1407]|uniref:DUF7730 domain-containing protein n=1 Tax=Grosmannia clavigera (strain kw1407 / UAMH 11150) TaxID=655863 RepID=F0XAQ5_GROCL|nr:uncharacterized protein CMQ_3775 [Grosmannia clavigera kw1407]EFX05706.1 hypothetical protein CMQ_3775 [Grosmannia clavigera kw1407]